MTNGRRWTLEGGRVRGQRWAFQTRSIEGPLNPIFVRFLGEARRFHPMRPMKAACGEGMTAASPPGRERTVPQSASTSWTQVPVKMEEYESVEWEHFVLLCQLKCKFSSQLQGVFLSSPSETIFNHHFVKVLYQ